MVHLDPHTRHGFQRGVVPMSMVRRPEPTITPRRDQFEALAAILDALARGVLRPLVEAPCGWGKSVLIAMLALALAQKGRRVLILAHRHELLEQNTGALLRLDPFADVGVCSASLRSDRLDAAVVVGGTATVFRRLQRLGHVDAVLLDEAHLLGPGSTSMLGTILKSLGAPPLVGFTATPYRTDAGSLVTAELFDEIIWRMGIVEAIGAGLLVPLITKSPKVGRIDTSGVAIVAGEFQKRPLEQVALAGSVTRDAVIRTLAVADDENRQALLFFAIGVAHCAAISAVLREQDIAHAVITGETPTEERAEAIARFRAGELHTLVNCNVLTVGFDARNIDLIAFMRPTVSPVLWAQAAGRGMRTWSGKVDCRLLDFGGNILRHGPINATKLRPAGARHDAEAASDRVRICPRCDEVNERGATVCTSCGIVLVKPRPVAIVAVESTAEAIDASAEPPRWVRVRAMRGGVHEKSGSAPSFRLRYSTEVGWVSEFLSLEHARPGVRWYAQKAWQRLSRHGTALPPPASACEALHRFCSGELREPRRLWIERSGAWWWVRDAEVGAP
jgi:DNA repair protein RadD